MLLIRLAVDSSLLVITFWGSPKLYVDFCTGSSVLLIPMLFTGQLYIKVLYLIFLLKADAVCFGIRKLG